MSSPLSLARKFPKHLLMVVCAGVALACVHTGPAHAANPAVVIPNAPLISPSSALSYYGTPVSPTPPTTRDPMVTEAARALRYDVDNIYAFVRDNVRLTPVFGLQKGARGVVLDGYGSAFDQAQFMVDCLREADAVASKGYNPVYKLGTITLTAAQFSGWTGISDAAVASKFLANGGIPATVTGSGASFSVSMLHIWVQVTISGTNYVFDPSYKPSTVAAGLSWQSQTGYNQATLLAAGGGATATTVNGFNIASFRAKLTEYRASLESYLAANAAGKRAEAVVGDDVITAHGATEDRRTSLPYATSTDRSWSGQIPDIFRTAFTVKLNGSAYGTYYADVDGGEIMGFTYSYNGSQFVKGAASTSPVIAASFLDPCDQYLSNKSTAATPATASIDINHPYAASAGGYADRTISRQIVSQVCANGRFFVSNDWGYTGNGVTQRMAPMAAQIRSDPTKPTDFTFGPTVANIASQYTSFLDLAGKAQSSVFQVHDLIGIHVLDNVAFKLASGQNQYSLATNPSFSFEAAVSAFGKAGTTTSDIMAAYMAGLGLSYAEGAVPRQETDSVYDMAALSLITQQDSRATSAGTYTTYLANPSAAPTWSSVQGSLSAYPSGSTSAASNYVSEGYSLLIPQKGALRQPHISVETPSPGIYRTGELWEGSGPGSNSSELTRSAFLAWRPSSGAGSVPDRIALVMYDQRRGSILKAGVGVPIQTGTDAAPVRKPDAPKVDGKDFIRAALNVDGQSGALSYAPASDLVDGAGDFPRSLSLQRVYSQRDQTNYGFGMGWKSNWYQVATMSNDGQLALGKGSAQAIASALVTIQALGDLVTTQDAQHLYAALQTASWLTDQTINNSVVVSRGLEPDHAFYAQASGNFVSAKADGATLSATGAPVVGIINRRLYLNNDFAFTDRDGSVRTYTKGPLPSADLSSPNIASGYTRKFIFMNQWTFPSGIKIDTAYTSTLAASDIFYLYRAYNNIGSAIYNDEYDYGSATEFPYCKTNGGLVYYKDPWPALISYKTPAAKVTFNMEAQVGWTLTVDPDNAHCVPGTLTPPMTQKQYMSRLFNVLDPANQLWPVGYASVGGMFGSTSGLGAIYKPSNTGAPDIAITYGGDGNVRSFTNLRGNSWNYYSTPFRSESVSPLQAAATGAGNVTYYDQYGQAIRSVDPLLRATTTTYDAWGRPQLVTLPEGNATQTAYDVRGNIVTQTQKAKPGSGLADLVTTTAYGEGPTVALCSNPVTCNKPTYTVDPRGFRSDYGWNATTGMPMSLRQGWNSAGTACQISTGGGCPSVTFAYGSGLTGFDPFTGGNSGPIYLPLSQTEAAQSGTTTTAYGYALKSFSTSYAPMSLQTVKRLVPTQVTVDNGGLNLVTCFDYDDAGNVISSRSPRGGGTCP